MKKLLLIAVTMAHCDLQSMWLESKIRKILPKRSYILSAIVKEPSNERKILQDEKKQSPRNTSAISIATSDTAANNEEFSLDLSDIKQSLSEATVTSSIDDSNSVTSDYVLMSANQMASEEVFTLIKSAQPLPNNSRNIPFFDEEGIFDMDMSDTEQSLPGYKVSEEYFPIHFHGNQASDMQKSQRKTSSCRPISRRKSSIESYYSGHN